MWCLRVEYLHLNQLQSKWICYNCFVLRCISVSKVPLACVGMKENSFILLVPCLNGVSGIANGKPWVSIVISMAVISTSQASLTETNKELNYDPTWLSRRVLWSHARTISHTEHASTCNLPLTVNWLVVSKLHL